MKKQKKKQKLNYVNIFRFAKEKDIGQITDNPYILCKRIYKNRLPIDSN